MNSLQKRINEMTQVLSSDMPKHEKISAALHAFSGLDITDLNKTLTKKIKKHLIAINEIFSFYPTIKTEEDYKMISEQHLDGIIQNIQQLCLALLGK